MLHQHRYTHTHTHLMKEQVMLNGGSEGDTLFSSVSALAQKLVLHKNKVSTFCWSKYKRTLHGLMIYHLHSSLTTTHLLRYLKPTRYQELNCHHSTFLLPTGLALAEISWKEELKVWNREAREGWGGRV